MSRSESVVLTNMCMVTDERGRVLVQNRNDPGWPGIVFPGGHVERGESLVDSVIREVREETGITVLDPKLCGVKQFQTREDERYVVFLFKASRFEGELQSSDEGEAMWIDRTKLFDQKCVDNFDHLVRIFEDDEISELYYTRDGISFL